MQNDVDGVVVFCCFCYGMTSFGVFHRKAHIPVLVLESVVDLTVTLTIFTKWCGTEPQTRLGSNGWEVDGKLADGLVYKSIQSDQWI